MALKATTFGQLAVGDLFLINEGSQDVDPKTVFNLRKVSSRRAVLDGDLNALPSAFLSSLDVFQVLPDPTPEEILAEAVAEDLRRRRWLARRVDDAIERSVEHLEKFATKILASLHSEKEPADGLSFPVGGLLLRSRGDPRRRTPTENPHRG